MVKLQIPRSQWTGTKDSRDAQRGSMMTPNYSDEMCCLGHLFCQLFPLEMANYMVKMKSDSYAFDSICMPASGMKRLGLNEIPEWMIAIFPDEDGKDEINNSIPVQILAELNDHPRLEQSVKEAGIAYILELYGYSVEFI